MPVDEGALRAEAALIGVRELPVVGDRWRNLRVVKQGDDALAEHRPKRHMRCLEHLVDGRRRSAEPALRSTRKRKKGEAHVYQGREKREGVIGGGCHRGSFTSGGSGGWMIGGCGILCGNSLGLAYLLGSLLGVVEAFGRRLVLGCKLGRRMEHESRHLAAPLHRDPLDGAEADLGHVALGARHG